MGHTQGVVLGVHVLIALVQLVLEAVSDLVVPLEVLDFEVRIEVVQVVPLVLDVLVEGLDGLLKTV